MLHFERNALELGDTDPQALAAEVSARAAYFARYLLTSPALPLLAMHIAKARQQPMPIRPSRRSSIGSRKSGFEIQIYITPCHCAARPLSRLCYTGPRLLILPAPKPAAYPSDNERNVGDGRGEGLLYITRIAAATLLTANLAGCTTVASRPPRLAPSSYACMRAVLQEKLPTDLPEKRAHCLAGGLIARYCSLSEAYLAGAGKELRDLLGAGDAQWTDWRADRVGIDCARVAADDLELASCCSVRGY